MRDTILKADQLGMTNSGEYTFIFYDITISADNYHPWQITGDNNNYTESDIQHSKKAFAGFKQVGKNPFAVDILGEGTSISLSVFNACIYETNNENDLHSLIFYESLFCVGSAKGKHLNTMKCRDITDGVHGCK
jgi:hypothetical protein